MSYNTGGRIVSDNLVMYLDAGNGKSHVSGSSTWTDISRNNVSASLLNGPTFSSLNGGYLTFDGSNDYCSIANPSTITGSQVSFCVWNTVLSNTVSTFTVYLEGSGGARIFAASIPWGGNNTVYFDAGNGTGAFSGAFDRINKGYEGSGWQYWVFTKNATAGTMRIYLNGNLWHSGTGLNAPVGTATTGYIATLPSSGYTNSRISMMKFYNKELSAAEILNNYNVTKKRFGL